MSMKNYFLIVILSLSFSGCSSPVITDSQESVNHKADRLVYMRRMLNDLNDVIYERHKSEMERDDDRKRYASNFANTLKTVSSIVAKFPQNDTTITIEESKLKSYAELSKKLYTQGETIQKIADSYDFNALNSAIEDVKTTCTKCHNIIGLGFDPLSERE